MRLTKILLENFRNYTKTSVATDAGLVLVLGDNAAGKTNFLESIFFLSRLKSFRAPDELLIKFGQEHLRVAGVFDDKEAEVVIVKNITIRRSLKLDGGKVKKAFWRTYPVVLFVPNDLNLFVLGPANRRKFFDEILSQKSRPYALSLVSLDHILKQKSALLQKLREGVGRPEELESWNVQLAEVSTIISNHRRSLVQFFNERINDKMKDLAGFQAEILAEYQSQIVGLGSKEVLVKLMDHRAAEIQSGLNLVGPHRDDLLIKKNNLLNIYNSSRGELRVQVLGLKLMQAEFLSDEKAKPIILLDDVFSELDETRRTKLLETLSGHQIFITSTEEHHLPKLAKDSLVLKVENDIIK